MESSKLVALLKQFKDNEWNAFNRFVQSPYCNGRLKVIQLFQLLKKEAPTWRKKKIEKRYIYSKLFPNEAYKNQRLVELRNALVKLIEQFWIINTKKEKAENYRQLAIAYHQHDLLNYRDINLEKSLQELEQNQMDVESYHNNMFDYHLKLHHLIEAEDKRNQEPNLQALHDHLDAFYLCIKLKYYCKVLNYQNFRSHQYDIAMMNMVLEEADKDRYKVYPSIQIYLQGVYTLLSIDNETQFYTLKSLLVEHTDRFSIDEFQNILTMARNFCIKNLNRGKRAYVKEAFELYKIEIEKELIIQDGKIPNAICQNIMKLALLLNETVWATNFLNDYQSKISKEIFIWSLANIRFRQEKYDEVLVLLDGVDFKEVLLTLGARAIILKTYFQLCRTTNSFEYEDKLEAYIDSFNAFLKRKKEGVTRAYLRYLNFVKFTSSINKLYWKPKLDKDKLAEINQQILATPETAEWDWLKEISKN